MRRSSVSVSVALTGGAMVLVGLLAPGCSTAEKPGAASAKPAGAAADSHDHDHDHAAAHDHPETLAEAVAELESLTKAVAERLAGDAQAAADDAVHAAGHLLDDMKALVETQTLTTDAKEAATKALDELYECFDTLDVALHAKAKEGAETVAEVHASIASRVEEAVKALKERFPEEGK
jgi:hypothetical protein